MRHVPAPAKRNRGLTLVEVCLVLALLVVIGAISAPLLEGSFSRAGLQSAGDLLRGAWARARLASMESGVTYVFRCAPKGSQFQIITLDELGLPASEAVPLVESDVEKYTENLLRSSPSRLPDGVVFAAAEISASSQVMATLGASGEGAWSSPILFRPDGTTSDASLVLANEAGNTVRVTHRGLTGISNTTEVVKEAVGP
jgi:hypothetical protein